MLSLKDRIILLLKEGKRTIDISDELGCAPQYISRVRRKAGFPTPRKPYGRYFSVVQKEKVKELWVKEDLSALAIAEKLNFPVERIISYLQDARLT